jgi:nicotinamide riboside kinase
LKKAPKIIVITGAESTGKTTLTERLSTHFSVPYMPEIAREYVEKLDRKYTFSDVETIARMQIELFRKIKDTKAPFIFIDTWLIVTKIWFEFVYRQTPDWLVKELTKNKIDLFLVCDTDLPWVYDPVRENGGETRKILQEKYIENIVNFGFNYKMVNGIDDERFKNAIGFINELQ